MAVAWNPRVLLNSLTQDGVINLPHTNLILRNKKFQRGEVHVKASTISTLYEKVSKLQPGDDLPPEYASDDPYSKIPPRRAGILVHPTSLPGPHGVGDFGEGAYKFLDWLATTGCTIWQVLPLVPPGRKGGEDGSPYAGQDANCGNTLLISLVELVKDGLLEEGDLPDEIPMANVNYDEVAELKDPLIAKAARNLVNSNGPLKQELENFRKDPLISGWLEEAALFAAIDSEVGEKFWWLWPEALRDRQPQALSQAREKHKEFISEFIAAQFLFQRQWQALLGYARGKGLRVVGDMPIYVGGHSADVWANREQFVLDKVTGVPLLVSGVPPDLFSKTGQLWGSPLYDWKAMSEEGYSWWANRMKRAFELYDEFRIDHFRGLAGYWAVDADAETAMGGKWKLGPRTEFFEAIKAAVGKVDIIAEDLGVITTDVVNLRREIEAPGMAVLQFAFGSDSKNPHLPHNHEQNQVVYPGTHDNDTMLGWWQKASESEKKNTLNYLHLEGEESEIHWDFIRLACSSVARTTIIALQDVLGLDSSARMNTPAVQKGNWAWRVGETSTFDNLEVEATRLRHYLQLFNRIPKDFDH